MAGPAKEAGGPDAATVGGRCVLQEGEDPSLAGKNLHRQLNPEHSFPAARLLGPCCSKDQLWQRRSLIALIVLINLLWVLLQVIMTNEMGNDTEVKDLRRAKELDKRIRKEMLNRAMETMDMDNEKLLKKIKSRTDRWACHVCMLPPAHSSKTTRPLFISLLDHNLQGWGGAARGGGYIQECEHKCRSICGHSSSPIHTKLLPGHSRSASPV